MQSRWEATARLRLVERLADRTQADSESFFDAHGLGTAYRQPKHGNSKKTRINSALHAAERRGDLDKILDAAQSYLAGSSAELASPSISTLSDRRDLPAPTDKAQQQLLQVVWDLFFNTTTWPTFAQVDRKFDRTFGLDVVGVAATLPDDLVQPSRLDAVRTNEALRLTVAGAAACQGAHEDLKIFLDVVRLAAKLEAEQLDVAGGAPEPTLTTDDVREGVQLPAAGRDATLARLGQLLAIERWGWSSSSSADPTGQDWRFSISRSVRRLRGVANLAEYWRITRPQPELMTEEPVTSPGTIFLVHGHDEGRHEVARLLEKITTDVDVVILGEQASRGRTLLEKFEQHGSIASFAVVLLTPDDVGRAVTATADQPRARQNVVFELGYFFGKLGRHRVVVLNKGGVEKPSDVEGIMYISYPTGDWKVELAKELTAAGFDVNLSKAP